MNNFERASIVILPLMLMAAAAIKPAAADSNTMCLNTTLNVWQPCSASNPLYVSPIVSGGAISTVIANQGASGLTPWPVLSTPAQSTPAAPDISTVTTGGTAVNAFSANHCAKGCYIVNPDNATVNLCGNGVGAASGTHSNGATICVVPGQSLWFSPRAAVVSVVSSDSAHPFGGEGYQ